MNINKKNISKLLGYLSLFLELKNTSVWNTAASLQVAILKINHVRDVVTTIIVRSAFSGCRDIQFNVSVRWNHSINHKNGGRERYIEKYCEVCFDCFE